MKEPEFRAWLEAQDHAQSSIATRLADARRVEHHYGDLDQAFDRDRCETIRSQFAYTAADRAANAPNPTTIAIDGDLYDGMATLRSAVSLYCRFREASDSAESIADQVRRYVGERLIEPARARGDASITIRAGDVHDALGLEQNWANVCQVLRGGKLRDRYDLPEPAIAGPVNSTTTTFTFDLGRLALDPQALEGFRRTFLQRFPDFVTFEQRGGYDEVEDAYKRPIIRQAQQLSVTYADAPDAVFGAALLELAASKEHNLLGYFKTYELLKDWRRASSERFDAAAGALARSQAPLPEAVQRFVDAVWPIMAEGQTSKPYGDSRIIATLIPALLRPTEAVFVRTSPFNAAAQALVGDKLFGWNPLSGAEYAQTLQLAHAIFTIMETDWSWRPRDLWDVQGFIWSVNHADRHLPASVTTASPDQDTMMPPTNLILYGPPGTGKTFATAEHAVRLCGEVVDGLSRDALMEKYRALSKAERIEFVTFHQSMAYEEFVEGLRPETGPQAGETDPDEADKSESPSAGFRLAPTPGIFRRIARRAETSTGPGGEALRLNGRTVFKMSLGEAANPDDAHLFEEAIRDGHIILGFEDIDWSDPKYEHRDEIMAACQALAPDTRLNAQSAVVQMPHIFRNWMKEGDWVVVSKGTKLFRAIGVITGGYRFVPREGRDYGHRRDVRWLWVDREGVRAEEIYARGFSMRTTYALATSDLKVSALERYANSQQKAGEGAPEPFVLVIDEINRANISKVFGELITLLEPDKRIGRANELRVRLPYSGDSFGVPANLHIVGTMNTADRSIALLDTALRRRFDFVELMPRADLLGTVDGIDLATLLATLNDRIEYLFDREHQIGHAYLMTCKTAADVDAAMRHKVIPLLAEYFYEDWAKVAAVLGDAAEGEGDHDGGFLARRRLAPPTGLGDLAEAAPRWRWSVRDTFDYAKLQ